MARIQHRKFERDTLQRLALLPRIQIVRRNEKGFRKKKCLKLGSTIEVNKIHSAL